MDEHDTPPTADESPRRARRGFGRVVLFVLALGGAVIVAALTASVVSAAPAGALLRGIDVSSWQHTGTSGSTCGRPIDWVQVRDAGISFAYVKSTESTTYTNPCFAQDWAGVESVGMLRGSYHYARPALPLSTAAEQARYFVSRAGSMTGPLDLPGMLDLEETGGLGATDLSNWTRTFLEEVTRLTGKKPVLYMGAYFFPGTIAPDISANYRLWLPSYPCQDFAGNRICDPYTWSGQPRLPTGWSTWTWWQFSSIENVPGIYANSTGPALDNVDMNWFCCDLPSLQALAGSGGAGGSPFGSIDVVTTTGPSTARVAGWAIDPDTRDPIDVHFYTDGVFSGSVRADAERSDVGAQYRGFGSLHGFDAEFAIPTSARQVCAWGINTGPGVNLSFGCRSFGGDPIANVDVVRMVAPGRVQVAGWAFDPDEPGRSIALRIQIGSSVTPIVANGNRSDVNDVYVIPGLHGFDAVVETDGGEQQVCIHAVNEVGPGRDRLLTCRTISLPTGSPFGSFDVALGGSGAVVVGGWAIDRDSVRPTTVQLVMNSVGPRITADGARPDLATVFPAYGAEHGWTATLPAAPGPATVCAFAMNTFGSGSPVLLGCRTTLVLGPQPFGSLDAVQPRAGAVFVAGWAIDPDTTDPIAVHVYVDSVAHGLTADGLRADVGAAFPLLGSRHGFAAVVPAEPGRRTVCAYAINGAGAGSNQGLGCRVVDVGPSSPFGALDVVAPVTGGLHIAGWALDPETNDPITVNVVVNGILTTFTASDERPDVGAAFGTGTRHGFDAVVPAVGAGPQSVCVFALNVGFGAHSLLGCRTL